MDGASANSDLDIEVETNNDRRSKFMSIRPSLAFHTLKRRNNLKLKQLSVHLRDEIDSDRKSYDLTKTKKVSYLY